MKLPVLLLLLLAFGSLQAYLYNPLAYYSFDYNDSRNEVNASFNGTFDAGVSNATGYGGSNAMYFIGASGVNSGINITNASEFQSLNNLTILFRVKSNATGSIVSGIVSKHSAAANGEWFLYTVSNGIWARLINQSSYQFNCSVSATPNSENSFTTIGMIWNGTNLTLWQNETKMKTCTPPDAFGPLKATILPVRIGAFSTTTNTVNGTMDDVYIMTYALTDAEYSSMHLNLSLGNSTPVITSPANGSNGSINQTIVWDNLTADDSVLYWILCYNNTLNLTQICIVNISGHSYNITGLNQNTIVETAVAAYLRVNPEIISMYSNPVIYMANLTYYVNPPKFYIPTLDALVGSFIRANAWIIISCLVAGFSYLIGVLLSQKAFIFGGLMFVASLIGFALPALFESSTALAWAGFAISGLIAGGMLKMANR